MRPALVFFIGPTNAGKTSILDAIRERDNPVVAFVEVGKLLRAKYLDPNSAYYNPDFFKGKAAPEHTEAEAYRLMVDGITASEVSGKRAVFIDGQPRSLGQLSSIMADYIDYPCQVIHVFCPRGERERRARLRDTDSAKLALSLARMDGDVLDVYEIDHLLKRHGVESQVVDTGVASFDVSANATWILSKTLK